MTQDPFSGQAVGAFSYLASVDRKTQQPIVFQLPTVPI